MKKSEMENKIQCLLENRGYKGNADDGKAVLEMLLAEGMLPPSRKVDFEEMQTINRYINEPFTVYYKWEPENETE